MDETKAPISYSIVSVTNTDSKRVFDFLRRFFLRDEPLYRCMGLLDDPSETCEEMEQDCIDSISDGMSLMAVSPDGDILGVCINEIMSRDEEECEESSESETDESSNPKSNKIDKLFNTLYEEYNTFERFPEVDKVLYIVTVSVDVAYRGHGIAKALFDKTKALAKDMSIPLIQVDCTSHFSAKAAERLGFHCTYKLVYSEYLDSEGKPVFSPELPHTCLKTLVCPVTDAAKHHQDQD